MIRGVEISIKASKKIDEISNYIESKWSERIRKEFIEKITKSIKIIRNSPEAFPISEYRRTIRKCVVTKQTTIFYRFNSKKITVIALFDTRQNPSNIKNIK